MIGDGQVSLRPATAADDEFILSVYASTREQEMAMVPWSAEQKAAFVRMQYEAQKRHYQAEFAHASHDIIYMDETPAGRLYLDRRADALHILDITMLPRYRGQGAGAILVRRLMDEARGQSKTVTIYVESFNPSVRFFERLGFRREHEQGLQWLMKWEPNP
jgi:ribosomal protein S18 acetylase RimI-like enzyme